MIIDIKEQINKKNSLKIPDHIWQQMSTLEKDYLLKINKNRSQKVPKPNLALMMENESTKYKNWISKISMNTIQKIIQSININHTNNQMKNHIHEEDWECFFQNRKRYINRQDKEHV